MKNDTEQLSFVNTETDNGPVVCLGMTFENDEARREYFRDELRKKLPELKKLEGFPLGEDEDIIALSDPPYYTACQNPWINNFIEEWQTVKRELQIDDSPGYHREPFASDVSEGKNNPVYMAHSYHTKVPHQAVMRYILHYTQPGDIVLDGFSGTGMTGVAANKCGDENAIRLLGYEVEKNKVLHNGKQISELGKRNTILSDLSPIASFISYNLNHPVNTESFFITMNKVLDNLEKKHSRYLTTRHGNSYGYINYIIWSDVFNCPNCANEVIFWDVAIDNESKKVLDTFHCPSCSISLNKRKVQRIFDTKFDPISKETYSMARQVPVLINYTFNNKRYEKVPDQEDIKLQNELDELEINNWHPRNHIPKGEKTTEPHRIGITTVNNLLSKRNLVILSDFYNEVKQTDFFREGLFLLTSSIPNLTKMYRWRINGKGGTTSGTLYICSTPQENNPINQLRRKLNDIKNALTSNASSLIGIQSFTRLGIEDNSVDYIFTDPPFGANLMYSELNHLWESWIKVLTNNKDEAIVNKEQKKNILDYKDLMYRSFKEAFRVLKPNHWITVEFSNSSASVWNVIQESIQKAGFIIANVSALDKKQGSFNAVTSTTAVKQDLVISAYKPKQENIEKMRREQNSEESAWTFVKQHLEQLPKFLGVKGEAQIIAERTPRILFDRMVAYHVQNGLSVPISSAEFQAGIAQRFPMRDGMAFLENQVAEYDKKRTLIKDFAQMSLFVSDENSAIEWIRQQLLKKPQTRQDLHPNYMKEIQHIGKHELLPELDNLLYQNFLRYDGDGIVPDQIASYLRKNYKDLRGLEAGDPLLIDRAMNRLYVPDPNKQADLEKLREKSLLREFDSYINEMESSKKKLKQFRTEAIRAGFKKAYSEKDFDKIVKVGDRLPESVIQEDDKLLMYYDNACIRLGL